MKSSFKSDSTSLISLICALYIMFQSTINLYNKTYTSCIPSAKEWYLNSNLQYNLEGEIMAVMITDECIACDACAQECPVVAILDDENEKNPQESIFYVKPESCVECVGHADEPRCVEACPTEGAIVWDMPYTIEFNEYYKDGNESGTYKIREHKKKGLMLPQLKEQPFIESISMDDRKSHTNIGQW